VRVTGHIVQEPGSLSISPSSSVSPYGASTSSAYATPSSSYLAPASSYSQPVSSNTASPPRSPASTTIPISPSLIYSTPTPLESRTTTAEDDLSQFGPQPGTTDIYFTMPSSPANSSVSAFSYYGSSAAEPATAVETPNASQSYYGSGASYAGDNYSAFGKSHQSTARRKQRLVMHNSDSSPSPSASTRCRVVLIVRASLGGQGRA
jgi:hypothetical protein